MSADLALLAAAALLTTAQAFVYSHGLMLQPETMKRGLGDRGLGEGLTGWAARARRSHVNAVETLVPFAALVLAAHAAGHSGRLTVVAGWTYLAGRVIHLFASLRGNGFARKLGWHTSLLAIALAAVSVFI